MARTIDDLYKSIVRFLLFEVDPETNDSAADIYTAWRFATRFTIQSPAIAAYVLEYLEAMKHCDRDLLLLTAKMDGYVTNKEAEQFGSVISGKEHGYVKQGNCKKLRKQRKDASDHGCIPQR